MAILSNINGKFAVDSTGAILFSTSHGTSGQILRSNGNAAPTWVAASTVIGGPYLPLTGGTLTGATATATGISFTVGGVLTASAGATVTGTMAADTVDGTVITDGFISWSAAQINRYGAAIELQYTPTNSATLVKIGANGSNPTIFNAYTGDSTFAGNVGIGISPGENLHIFKSDATALIQASNTSGVAQLEFFPRDASNVAHKQSIKGVDSNLTFLTGGNSGNSYVPTERMRINSSGNVGIGLDPVYKLDVRGERFRLNPNSSGRVLTEMQNGTGSFYFAIDDTTASAFGGANSARTIYSQGAYPMAFWTNGSERLTIDSSGNVGIGTSAPSQKLQVVGNAHIDYSLLGRGFRSGNRGELHLNATGANDVTEMFFGYGDGYTDGNIRWGISDRGMAAGTLNIYRGPAHGGFASAMHFDTSLRAIFFGDVGIGTTSPFGSTTNEGLNVDTGGHSSIMIGDGVNDGGMIQSSDNSRRIIIGANVYDSPTTSWSRFNASGAALVDVYGEGTTPFISLNVDAGTTGYPTPRLFINSVGNVGIGTSTPSTKLQIGDYGTSGGNTLAILNSNGNQTLRLADYSTSYGFDIVNDDAGYLNIIRHANSVAGTTAFTIKRDNGNVGIGVTVPSEKLHVDGNIVINDRIIGSSKNYATSQGWLPGAAGTFSSQIGYYGGNFSINGAAAENSLIWGLSAFGNRALQWQTIGESQNNADGGWNKSIDNLPDGNSHAYMSYVYVKRTSSATTGTFYYGCQQVLDLAGNVNGNPYFHVHGIGSLPQDVWCVAIGIIQAYTDTNTATPTINGIYRVDTGVKILTGTSFKSQSGVQTTQSHRTYHYYSTDPAATLAFANPGFYVVDGTEPSLSTLVN